MVLKGIEERLLTFLGYKIMVLSTVLSFEKTEKFLQKCTSTVNSNNTSNNIPQSGYLKIDVYLLNFVSHDF